MSINSVTIESSLCNWDINIILTGICTTTNKCVCYEDIPRDSQPPCLLDSSHIWEEKVGDILTFQIWLQSPRNAAVPWPQREVLSAVTIAESVSSTECIQCHSLQFQLHEKDEPITECFSDTCLHVREDSFDKQFCFVSFACFFFSFCHTELKLQAV